MRHTNNFQFSISNFQFIIALSAMIMTSCVNEVPYRAEDSKPRLYLNAILLPDSQLTATVGRTAHFLEDQQAYRLSDAEVTAVINGNSLPLAYDEDTKNYHSSYRLRSGDKVMARPQQQLP